MFQQLVAVIALLLHGRMENWLRNPQYVLEAWHGLTEKTVSALFVGLERLLDSISLQHGKNLQIKHA